MAENQTTQVRAFMTFDAVNEDELKRCLNHHIEHLIDFDDVSDVLSSVHGVTYYNPDDKHDGSKLTILAELLSDILQTEPSDEELDNDDKAIELYDELHNLKIAMENMGLL